MSDSEMSPASEASGVDRLVMLPCPFCGVYPKPFGRVLMDGIAVEQVKHPVLESPRCPLNMLVFTVDSWNRRAT